MIVRVSIDKNRCIGCGLCEESLPDMFRVGDFTARVKTPVAEATEELLATRGDCPTEAIILNQISEADVAQS